MLFLTFFFFFSLSLYYFLFIYLFMQLLTQICLALSTLLLHAVEHEKPIEKLFYSLQNLQNEDNGNIAVLETLTVLPEVVDDYISYCCKNLKCRYDYEQEVCRFFVYIVSISQM